MEKQEGVIDALDEQFYIYSFELKNPQVEKYFNLEEEEIKYFNGWQNEGLFSYLNQRMGEFKNQFFLDSDFQIVNQNIEDGKLNVKIRTHSENF